MRSSVVSPGEMILGDTLLICCASEPYRAIVAQRQDGGAIAKISRADLSAS
jgi:hypothetical protein